MTLNALIQLTVFYGTLLALSWPLGLCIARLFERCDPQTKVNRFELILFRAVLVDVSEEMSWKEYAISLLVFSVVGFLFIFILQRFQDILIFNPESLGAVAPDLAFNTAASFVTNTNWQAYSGESTLSYLTQMLGLTVQNFVSAASGIAVLFALMRGFIRARTSKVGNFWRDVTLVTIYLFIPLSFILSILLVSQGVVQTFEPYAKALIVEPITDVEGKIVTEQIVPLGPAASQVAIKQLGTNGGGFFGVNSAHPLENPTPLSNFFELLAILLIPAALCHTFGRALSDQRQGWALFATMSILFLLITIPTIIFELSGNPALTKLAVIEAPSGNLPGGNMEGKEARFGPVNSAIWATATTAASNGAVNSMHDSFTPLGGMMPMILMQLGEVVFGGVGSGLYGMIAFAIVTVFIAGLMVGRTPEYLGKKISAFEMKMVSLVVLIPCALTLIGTAASIGCPSVLSSLTNPGAHGLSQALYAYSSMGNNNGSAFAGFGANIPLHNLFGGVVMFISRFWLAIPILALAGSLAQKPCVPKSAGTLETDTPLFVVLLCVTVLIIALLAFIPALALGPIAEQLTIARV